MPRAPKCRSRISRADEQYRDVRISPGGDYLAASVLIDGKAALSLIRVSDMQGVDVRPRGDSELAQFWWVSPRRVMYTVGASVGQLEAPVPTGELYAVNADGTGGGIIFGARMGGRGDSRIALGVRRLAYGDLIDDLPDNPKQALIASYAENNSALVLAVLWLRMAYFPKCSASISTTARPPGNDIAAAQRAIPDPQPQRGPVRLRTRHRSGHEKS